MICPSASVPEMFTANMKALLPSLRESICTQTHSLSESRSRRVSRSTIGVLTCSQSKPK